jgi:hypothetical protein
MPQKTFPSVVVLACAVVALAGRPAAADEPKKDKDRPAPAGVWMKSGGDLKMEFADKDVLKISPHGDKAAIVIVCRYTAGKDNRVKVKVTDLEASEEVKDKLKGHVPVGTEFSFQWQAKGDSATLDDLKGDKADGLKAHLEGTYDSKK